MSLWFLNDVLQSSGGDPATLITRVGEDSNRNVVIIDVQMIGEILARPSFAQGLFSDALHRPDVIFVNRTGLTDDQVHTLVTL